MKDYTAKGSYDINVSNINESSAVDNAFDERMIKKAVDFLLLSQNADGGWADPKEKQSSIYITAITSITLRKLTEVPQQLFSKLQIAGSLRKAANYLMTKQNSDGGFGLSSESSSPTETALACVVLSQSGAGDTALKLAKQYLMSTQSENGSWNDEPETTVLGLQAFFTMSSQAESEQNHFEADSLSDDFTEETLKNAEFLEKADSEKEGGEEGKEIKESGRFTVVNSDKDSVTSEKKTELEELQKPHSEDVEKIPALNEQKESVPSDKEKDTKRKVSLVTRRRAGNITSQESDIESAGRDRGQAASTPEVLSGGITGCVFDNITKQGIKMASVEISGNPKVASDNKGDFRIDGVTSGRHLIRIVKSGYSTSEITEDVEGGIYKNIGAVYLTPICIQKDSGDSNVSFEDSADRAKQMHHAHNVDKTPDEASAGMCVEIDRIVEPVMTEKGEARKLRVGIDVKGLGMMFEKPALIKAVTDITGHCVSLIFNTAMKDFSADCDQFLIIVDSEACKIAASEIRVSDYRVIDLILEKPIEPGQELKVSCTEGALLSAGGMVVSFSEEKVENLVMFPIHNQDGFGYSGYVVPKPLGNSIFMTAFGQWPSGFYKSFLAFAGGIFDGSHIWMVPANADSVVRIDKETGAMTAFNQWPDGFKKANLAFAGGIFDGSHIWMVPANADSVVRIDKETGAMTAFNQWPDGFKKGGYAFAGGIFDGSHIWMVPSYADSVVRIDKETGAMTAFNQWPDGFKKGGHAFAGGIFDGSHIWMVPANADSVVRIDKETGAMTAFNQWPDGFKKGEYAFAGGVFDGESIWMIPYYADRLVKVDINDGIMKGYNQRSPELNKAEYVFSGGVFDGESIWMIPVNADSVVKIDKKTGFVTKHDRWPTGFTKGVNAFSSGVFDGESIWMIPSYADKVVKLSTFSLLSVTANVTAGESISCYVSQQENQEGILFGQGLRGAVCSLNTVLVPGSVNYLHIKATDASGLAAAFMGDFTLNDESFCFANGTQRLITGESCWTAYSDGFGGNIVKTTTVYKNGNGKGGTKFGIDLNAEGIWAENEGTVFFSTPIHFSASPLKSPVSRVRVIDSLPANDISIDEDSFTIKPYNVINEPEETIIEWRFDELQAGECKSMQYLISATGDNPLPEGYLISNGVDVFYNEGQAEAGKVRLGPLFDHFLNFPASNELECVDGDNYTDNMNINNSPIIPEIKSGDEPFVLDSVPSCELHEDGHGEEALNVEPDSIGETESTNGMSTIYGEVAVQPNRVYQGLAATVTYKISATELKELKRCIAQIEVIDHDTGESKRVFEIPMKDRVGSLVEGSLMLSTGPLSARVYDVIIQYNLKGIEKKNILAKASFEVRLIDVVVT